MSFEEKGTWTHGILAVVLPVIYASIVFPQLATTPATDIEYQMPMLWTIGASIVLAITASILVAIGEGIASPKTAGKSDQRDKDIARLGEYRGGLLLGFAMIVPLGLTLARFDHFWIANAIYAAFILSAILTTIVKLRIYRRGF